MKPAALAVLLVFVPGADADDKPDPAAAAKVELKARVEKYLDAATPGVYFSDDKDVREGRIERVFVVGVSPINPALGADDGLEVAKERAEESAKAEFVKWLGSKVTVRKAVTNEVVLPRDGEEGANGGVRAKEVARRVERRTKEFDETASSVVRGLKVVGVQQGGKPRQVVIVYVWDAKTADGAGKVGDKLNPPVAPKTVIKPGG